MMDEYLKKFSDKYDTWLDNDQIDYSSRVIPIHESLAEEKQHVIPKDQAEEILGQAGLIALAECVCRTRYKNCDKPLEVCFVLNETGEKWIEQGRAKQVGMTRAKEILKQADAHGLVHMTLFKPDREVFAMCSCCSCCCHDLQLLLTYGKSYITAKSEFKAQDDPDRCVLCEACIDRCPFKARTIENGLLVYSRDDCYGCGLCITTCPENAIQLVKAE